MREEPGHPVLHKNKTERNFCSKNIFDGRTEERKKRVVKLIIKKSDGTFCKNPEDICIRKNRKTERLFEILEKEKNRILSENVEQN